jgi:hypothetical protein
MDVTGSLSQFVESYRFGDVVTLWARERLEHEVIIARALARAVVCDGLRLQSIDARWAGQQKKGLTDKPMELRGYPYVGYTARPDCPISILRISALDHLFSIVERAEEPDLGKLHEEFIYRDNFRAWLLEQNLPFPKFWFA